MTCSVSSGFNRLFINPVFSGIKNNDIFILYVDIFFSLANCSSWSLFATGFIPDPIFAKIFSGISKIEQHKIVYKALKGKMGNELHALALNTIES